MNHLLPVASVEFPNPMDISINMMPFIIGDIRSIPSEFRQYWPVIDACDVESGEHGKVGYLSIMESPVKGGKSQRRGGIHTEGHPALAWGGGGTGWGGGEGNAPKRQGLYMGSNIPAACRAWDAYIGRPGVMGDCESYRPMLEWMPTTVLGRNELYWLTDRTPHESLPLESDTYRQWFRLVTSRVDVWYRDHSTPNSLGVIPTCRIVEGNKFANV